MTLGENIWAAAIGQVDWWKCDEGTLIALGKIVIQEIDANFADLTRDHEAEVADYERRDVRSNL